MTNPRAAAVAAAREAQLLIEVGEQRALAIDGPVGHFRDELSDSEWRRLWLALGKFRRLTEPTNTGSER